MGISFSSILFDASVFVPLTWSSLAARLFFVSAVGVFVYLVSQEEENGTLPPGYRWYGYYDRADGRLFVPKALPILGWTVNWAHSRAALLVASAACCTAFAVGMSISLAAPDGNVMYGNYRPYNSRE